jgi:hypothetical protein
LRRYIKRWQTKYIDENDDLITSLPDYTVQAWGRGLHSPTFQVNLSRF